MDWEYFFRYGWNPALQSLQDYQQFMRQSQLSGQAHKQRMKETKQEYGLRTGLTDYEMQWRERLARINADLERSLAADKEDLHVKRLGIAHDYDMKEIAERGKHQRLLAKMYNDAGLKRANVYKEIAQINNQLKSVSQFNPEALPQVNLTTWNSMLQNHQMLNDEIQANEIYFSEIRNNPLFDQIHRGTMTEGGFESWSDEQFRWYKEQLAEINRREKTQRELRTALLMTQREVVKFASDAKIGNPISMDMPEVQEFLTTQIGYPIPVNLMKPQSQDRNLADHLQLIETAVMNNADLPPDYKAIQAGFDPNWLKTNWPQYREFYRNRLSQNLQNLGQGIIGDLSKPMKKLGELLTTFFY